MLQMIKDTITNEISKRIFGNLSNWFEHEKNIFKMFYHMRAARTDFLCKKQNDCVGTSGERCERLDKLGIVWIVLVGIAKE